jgi:hypothetical protein
MFDSYRILAHDDFIAVSPFELPCMIDASACRHRTGDCRSCSAIPGLRSTRPFPTLKHQSRVATIYDNIACNRN